MGKIYFDEKNYNQLEAVLKELKDSCVDKTSPTGYDKAKGHLLLEVLALEIQMCIATKEQRRMKQVF